MPSRGRMIAVADCETDPFLQGRIPSPFVWGWYNGEEYRQFDTVRQFLEFVTRTPMICYAHNGGRFDWHFIKAHVPNLTEVMVINGRLARFKIGECEFRDSWNIIPVPLAAYQKTEIDYSKFEKGERDKPENRAEIEAYLRDDCVFLWELVNEFISEFGRGLTIAGTAMRQWRKISGRENPDDDGTIYNALSPYYYGGRCQAFEAGIIERPFQLADINSAYPYAMLSKHPIGTTFDRVNAKEAARIHDDVLPTAFLRLRCRSFGCFPVRQENGSLDFPFDGEMREFTITGHEFIAGLETGAIKDIALLEAFVFEELTDFRDYVTHFYNARREAKARGDKARTLFYKLLMNSLYGKFAANPDSYRKFVTWEPEDLDERGEVDDGDRVWTYAGDFGPRCLIATDLLDDERRFYNLATGASITGYVRAFLWRAICKSEGAIYCDTDSIAADNLSRLAYGSELGQWELEGEFDYAAVGGKKLYAFRSASDPSDWKIATKGVRLTPEQIVRIAKGETVSYAPDVPVYSIHKPPHFLSRSIRRTALAREAVKS